MRYAMYDLNKKIIFTHPPKCAGTSIEDLFGWRDLTSEYAIRKFRRIRHASLKTHVDELVSLNEDVSDYFKFSCIRNPWDTAVSFFYHDKYSEITRFKENNPTEELPSFLKFVEYSSFEEYINYQYKRYKTEYNFLETKKFLYLEGQYSLDYIVRYENYELCINWLKQKYTIQKEMQHFNKQINKPKDLSYRDYYTTNELIEKVAEMAKTTICLFNYSF